MDPWRQWTTTKVGQYYIVQKTNFYIGSTARSDTWNLKNKRIIQIFTTQTMANKFKGKIDQWIHSTIIIEYNSYFKPMDNGSMITWPMDGMDIS
jgi:hypothetical protein